ncbi:hypothetical protein GEMRC1_002536 [Eukaryota sp. GEM-RC1]
MSSFSDLFNFCLSLAHTANKVLRLDSQGQVDVFMKDPETIDYVTSVDLHIEEVIVNALKYHFPSVRVIGEESIEAKPVDIPLEYKTQTDPVSLALPEYDLSELVVWIDPLDGTSYFVQKEYESVSFLLGISFKGRPVAGIISQPLNVNSGFELVYGIIGIGAFIDGKPLNPQWPPSDEMVITVSDTLSQKSFVDNVVQNLGHKSVLHNNGTGTKLLTVIRGFSHAFIQCLGRTKRWDTCAGEAIIVSMGGTVFNMDKELIEYNPDADFANTRGCVAVAPVLDADSLYSRLVLPEHIPVSYT